MEDLTDPTMLRPMIAPERTALVVIDVQEDFIGPDGAAGAWGIDLGRFQEPLSRLRAVIATARRAGATIVLVRVVTTPETDSDALKTFHRRRGRPPESVAICRAGTKGADYHGISPEPGDLEIQKPLFSSFVGTDLDAQLRARGVDTLVVLGFTTECCVDCTVRDAFHRNYHVIVVGDACQAYEDSLHAGALDALAKNCALVTDARTAISAWS